MTEHPRPYIELSNPGRLTTGDTFFLLTFYPEEAVGGGNCIVWSGTSYELAIESAHQWQQEGILCVDTVGDAL